MLKKAHHYAHRYDFEHRLSIRIQLVCLLLLLLLLLLCLFVLLSFLPCAVLLLHFSISAPHPALTTPQAMFQMQPPKPGYV
jgi:energy-coupling factor transporter transmembrane protein EcfT